jgi:hypothetical protein
MHKITSETNGFVSPYLIQLINSATAKVSRKTHHNMINNLRSHRRRSAWRSGSLAIDKRWVMNGIGLFLCHQSVDLVLFSDSELEVGSKFSVTHHPLPSKKHVTNMSQTGYITVTRHRCCQQSTASCVITPRSLHK